MTRYCEAGGTWSRTDISPCTLDDNIEPFLLLWLTLETEGLPLGSTVGDNGLVTLDNETSALFELQVRTTTSHHEIECIIMLVKNMREYKRVGVVLQYYHAFQVFLALQQPYVNTYCLLQDCTVKYI